MKQNIENITKAAQCATLLVSDLRQANTGAETVQLGDTLLDLIGEACALEKKLKRLLYAVREDGRRAGQLEATSPDLLRQRDKLRESLRGLVNVATNKLCTKAAIRMIANESRAVLAETEAA